MPRRPPKKATFNCIPFPPQINRESANEYKLFCLYCSMPDDKDRTIKELSKQLSQRRKNDKNTPEYYNISASSLYQLSSKNDWAKRRAKFDAGRMGVIEEENLRYANANLQENIKYRNVSRKLRLEIIQNCEEDCKTLGIVTEARNTWLQANRAKLAEDIRLQQEAMDLLASYQGLYKQMLANLDTAEIGRQGRQILKIHEDLVAAQLEQYVSDLLPISTASNAQASAEAVVDVEAEGAG